MTPSELLMQELVKLSIAAAVTFGFCLVMVPLTLGIARLFGLYAIVEERKCRVYVLFGKVIATLDEPGLHILFFKMGLSAFVVNWLGTCHVLDMRLERRTDPLLQGVGGLDVVVAVHEHGGLVWPGMQPVGGDDRVEAGLGQTGVVEADRGEGIGDPLPGAPDLVILRRIGADRFHA